MVGPKAGWPHNCLKMHPIAVFSVLTALNLLHPLAFLNQVGGSQLLTAGSFAVECHLNYVPQYGSQYSQTHSCSLLPHMQLWCGLGTCFQGSECAERSSYLTLEVRSSGQAWRSYVLEAKQFLLDRGLKTLSLLMPYLPRKKTAFPAYCVLSDTHAGKRLLGGHFCLEIS